MILRQALALGKSKFTCFICGRTSYVKNDLLPCEEVGEELQSCQFEVNDEVYFNDIKYQILSISYAQGGERTGIVKPLLELQRAGRHELLYCIYGKDDEGKNCLMKVYQEDLQKVPTA